MAANTPNMGLREWNVGTDPFSYTELFANWDKIDAHDHTTGKGVQIPSGGIANLAVTSGKIAADAIDATKILDGSVGVNELAANSVTTAKVLDANVTVAKLAADAAPQILTGSTAGSTVVTPSTVTSLNIGLVRATSPLTITSGKAVITTAGFYSIAVTVDFQAIGTETFRGIVLLGSSIGIFASNAVPGVYTNTRLSISSNVELPLNEQVTVQVIHNGSVNKNVDVYRFGMRRLAL
jgi:hypothetical protein